MSLGSILTAVRDELISKLEWVNDENCGVRGGEGAPPGVWATDFYVSIVPASWSPPTQPGNLNFALDESYNIDIIITQRTGIIPNDRLMGEGFLDAVRGLEPRVREIMVVMRKNRYNDGTTSGGVLNRANAKLPGTDKIIEPLRWLGNDPKPSPVGPDWFQSKSQTDARSFGWIFGLHYGEARRIQTETNLE